MPAHDNSEFCSRSCSNAGAGLQQIIDPQSTMDAARPYALRRVSVLAGETGEEASQWWLFL